MVIRKRLDIIGPGLVFITTTVHKWIPVFKNRFFATTLLNQFQESIDYFKIGVSAYVLMPSHLHALIYMPRIEKLSRFMQSFKILSSKIFSGLLGQELKARFIEDGKFRFWQPRFDDLIIFSHQQFIIKMEYIHNNPVKKGIVERASDYAFSSASDWIGGKSGFVRIDKDLHIL